MDITKNSSAVYLSASIFLEELMRISKGIVWKNTYLANRNENQDYSIETELFISASKGVLTFDNIYQLEFDIMSEMGMSQTLMSICYDDKYQLPRNLRGTYTNLYIKRILEKDPLTGHYLKYEEHNNYYRTLAGLPEIGDTDYIYNTKYDDIDKYTPIHLLPLSDRYNMERNGYLDELIKQYPDKKYLKHIASKHIDIFMARVSERFSILYMHPSEYDNLTSDFTEVYNNARYNVSRVYYTEAFRKNNNLYDNFLAMAILFMTIQLMHYKYLDVDITRDFYDLESIRYIYESYNVPFFSDIPLQYHHKIVKNINRLISYKGSTRVFFDLFDLFDYGRMDVFEYYLIKTHKFDSSGVPLFVYKEDGTLDEKAVFDIKFGKVRLYDDPPLELSDVSNHVSYESITGLDPFWISDADLLDKIYGENFNYLETKYIGIQTVFDMMKIVYESSYFIQMIISNRASLSATSLFYNNINSNINIFDMIVYLSALICEKYGYEGNISTELPSVSRILGFNFKDLASTIQKHVRNDPILSKDSELRSLLLDMNVNDINSVNNTFRKITRLRQHVSEKVLSSGNREVYFAYNNLEKIMLSTQIVESLYRKKNGEVAESFKDMLGDINPQLYVRLITPDLDIDHEIDTVLVLFMNTFNELKYFESIDGMDIGIIIQHLFNILNFFKSAKAELTGYNIIYIITSRGMNKFKLFSEIVHYSENNGTRKDKLEFLTDLIDNVKTLLRQKEELLLIDTISDPKETIRLEYDKLLLDSMIKGIINILKLEYDDVLYYDVIVGIINKEILESRLNMGSGLTLIEEKIYYENNITRINDTFDLFVTLTHLLDIIESPMVSKINKLRVDINIIYEFMSLSDDVDMRKDVIKILDSITELNSNLNLLDLITSISNIIRLGIHTKAILTDDINKIIEDGNMIPDKFNYLVDTIAKINSMGIHRDMSAFKDSMSDPKERMNLDYDHLNLKLLLMRINHLLELEHGYMIYHDTIGNNITSIEIDSKMQMGDSVTKLEERIIYENNIIKIMDGINHMVELTRNSNIIHSPLVSIISDLGDMVNIVYESIIKKDIFNIGKDELQFIHESNFINNNISLDTLITSIDDIIKLGYTTNLLTRDRISKIYNTGTLIEDNISYLKDNIASIVINQYMDRDVITHDDSIILTSDDNESHNLILILMSLLSKINESIKINQKLLMVDEINISGQNKQNNVVMGFSDKLLLLKEQLIN